NTMKKKQLEIILQRLKTYEKPKAELEQYPTNAEIAAKILFDAYSLGDIEGKKVCDLGCGTGIFAIGAAILAAKEVVAVDIDKEVIDVAKENADLAHVNVRFVISDIKEFNEKCDTVIMNPPFGSQKEHADTPFLIKALEIANVVHSIHMLKTENYIENVVHRHNGMITHKQKVLFEIKHMFKFHTREKAEIEAMYIRIKRI
ncbi:MAG: METTL5 family protein, partial [Thermoplasmata archaeon]